MKKNKILYLVLITMLIRIVISSILELGNDEVYYYTYALHLQSNYFDHPPGVGILIKLFTFNLHLQSEVFIRLGAVICAAIGTFLCYRIGTFIRNERTGWFAALLYNTSIYTSIIAGTFILPDSPQVVCWLATLYVMLQIVQKDKKQHTIKLAYWIWLGVLSGLCIMCKVHGAFLWIGFGLYILLYNRKMLRNPRLYVAVIVTAIIISPIIFWNLQHNFITWRYHSERVAVNRFSIDTDSFIQTVIGQIFYNNPFNTVVTIIAIFFLRKRRLMESSCRRLLSLCGWPIILVVTAVSLFRVVLPHWTGPGFMTLAFIAAAYLDEKLSAKPQTYWPAILTSSVVFVFVLIMGGISLIHFYPGTFGNKAPPQTFGEGDFTLDMSGWNDFGKQFNNWQDSISAVGIIEKDIPIVCNKWFPAAHLDYYVARRQNKHIIGIGLLEDLHHYAWLNRWRGNIAAGENALCIVPSNYGQPVQETYSKYFNEIIFLRRFAQERNGQTARYFDVFLLKNFNATDELHNKTFLPQKH